MKKLTGALVVANVFSMFVFSECVKEDFKRDSSETGIVFGANAGYAMPDTKTEYGDYVNESGQRSQKINWVEGDEVMVYSPQSPSGPRVDYSIKDVNGNQAALSAGENNLQWGTETEQNFYAIYPSINSIRNDAVKELVSFDETVFKGYVPINQQHEISYDAASGKWTAKPNMDYLYMAATQTANVQESLSESKGVNLGFVPLTSTLEITFVGPMEHPMASFNVIANDGDAIAGNFECNLENGNTECTATSQGYTREYVTVSTYYNDNGTNKPLRLNEGDSITFNVFLLPHDNLDNLSIRVAGFNAGSMTMNLEKNGSSIVVSPRKKTIVITPAPGNFGELNSWMTGLPDEVYVSQLSIPGTANSFSYMYNGSNPDWYKTQTANIETQWNVGIRCFELVCTERKNGTEDEPVTNLEDAQLQCNRTNIGMTFGAAVEAIWEKVQKTGEFAMIIPAYESTSGHGGNAVIDFANALNEFYNSHTHYKYVTYGRNITLGDARGSLMFVARITSEEDENKKLPNPEQGVFISGWGSLKDTWARRGYSAPDWAVNDKFSSAMESYMINVSSNYSPPAKMPERNNDNVNFLHATTRADGTSTNAGAYIQSWPRVVPQSMNYALFSNYTLDIWSTRYDILDYTRYCYWKESFSEKKYDVWNTFLKAIESNSGQQGDAFYINNLDGYFVDQNIPLSYKPYVEGRKDSYIQKGEFLLGYDTSYYDYGDGGTAGNIKKYAKEINTYFYNEILKYGTDNIYGPLNVILLDMVYSEADGNGPGSYLPSVIINNNYRFPLLTSGE